jgi:hypothetical protein
LRPWQHFPSWYQAKILTHFDTSVRKRCKSYKNNIISENRFLVPLWALKCPGQWGILNASLGQYETNMYIYPGLPI